MRSAVAKIQACETIEEVIRVAHSMLVEALKSSAALRSLGGPTSIETVADISQWVRELKSTADSQIADGELFPNLYATLRAAMRRAQAIEESPKPR